MPVLVEKNIVDVVIFTAKLKIQGKIHLLARERVSDFMESEDGGFLPVTDGAIFHLDSGDLLYHASFLSLNRRDITLIFPAAQIIS